MMTKCNFLPKEMANDSYTERGEEEREGEREKEDVNWWVEAIKGGNFDQRTFYPVISFKFFFPTFVYSFQNYFWNHVLGTNRSKMFKIYIFFQSIFDFSLIKYMPWISFNLKHLRLQIFFDTLTVMKKSWTHELICDFVPLVRTFLLDTVLIILITRLIIFLVISFVKGWYWIRPVTLLSFHPVNMNQESPPSSRFHSC